MKKNFTEQDLEIYNMGVKTGKEHSDPSPDTKNFMDKVYGTLDNLKEVIGELKTNLELNNQLTTQLKQSRTEDKKDLKDNRKWIINSLLACTGSILLCIGSGMWYQISTNHSDDLRLSNLESRVTTIEEYDLDDYEFIKIN